MIACCNIKTESAGRETESYDCDCSAVGYKDSCASCEQEFCGECYTDRCESCGDKMCPRTQCRKECVHCGVLMCLSKHCGEECDLCEKFMCDLCSVNVQCSHATRVCRGCDDKHHVKCDD
jgi:hypothetical protein